MRSDNVKKGPERAPNRSLFYALGYTPEELERPLIGVVSAYSEIVPGHMNLDKLADAVKAGIRMAGGTPVLVPAIGVCDGIAMGHIGMKYSLASRELICDSVETMFMAHQLDGLVLVPNCDKIVPGMVMAAVRMDVPAIVCSGGPMLAGSYGGDEVSLSKMFEAVGAYKAGMIDDAQLEEPVVPDEVGDEVEDAREDQTEVDDPYAAEHQAQLHGLRGLIILYDLSHDVHHYRDDYGPHQGREVVQDPLEHAGDVESVDLHVVPDRHEQDDAQGHAQE